VAQATVGKWGKNLAVRFPGEIARAASLSDGERVQIEARDGDIVIRRAPPHFTLEELFKGKRPKQWRAAYAGDTAPVRAQLSAARSIRNNFPGDDGSFDRFSDRGASRISCPGYQADIVSRNKVCRILCNRFEQ